MCCTAKTAITTAYSYCEGQSDEDSCNSVGDDLCKWTSCADVGYCVDPSDAENYDDRRRMLELEAEYDAEYQHAPPTPKPTVSSGWGTPKTPKPTMPPKTPRPTEWVTPKPTNPPKTPRPTEWKTPKPTNPPKTPKPVMVKTPRPTPDRYCIHLNFSAIVRIYPNICAEHQNLQKHQRRQDQQSGRHQSQSW